MATLVDLNEVSPKVQGAQLNTYTDLADALNYIGSLAGNQYSGNVIMQNVNGTITWILAINNQTTGGSAQAALGDIIIIKNDSVVSVCKQANFGSMYSIKTP
jgi:hypothetical protein